MLKRQAVLAPIVFASQLWFQEETKFHNFAIFLFFFGDTTEFFENLVTMISKLAFFALVIHFS